MEYSLFKRILGLAAALSVMLCLPGAYADMTLNIGTNNVSGNGQQNFISLEGCTIVFPTAQGYVNEDVVQFYNPDGSQYSAFLKTQVQNNAPALPLNSFNAGDLRGWSGSNGYQYVLFGRYYQDYIDQPILWRILTVKNGRALLLSELILDTRSFDPQTNIWENSELRSWLNSDFYNAVFSATEKAAILDNGKIGKLFLPSAAELSNAEYGFNTNIYQPNPNRSASGTMYAYNNNLWDVQNSDHTNYYARSAANSKNVHLVTGSGKIMLGKVTRDNVGVRPACWVDVSRLPFSNGEGSMLYPFQ